MEDKTVKNLLYDIGFLICIFLVFISFPFSKFINNVVLLNVINSFLRFGFVVFLYFYLKKNKKFSIKNNYSIRDFALLPFIIVCFSNIIFVIINNVYTINFNIYEVLSYLLYYLSVALSEEFLFRNVVFNYLKPYFPKFKLIIISSLIFSLTHLLNFFSTFNIVSTLLQCGYTLFIGYFLAVIYTYSNYNIIYCVIFHLLYDFVDDTIFLSIYSGGWNTLFYIVNITIGLIFFIYSGILIYTRKKEIEPRA